ncbi:MAG: zinc ribbon domain-containing protein [Pyrinomonadaceae bacterium]
MYCPNCAKEIQQDLNYCNSCGFRLSSGSDRSELVSGVRTLGVFGGIGLIGFVFLILMMIDRNLETPALIVIGALYLFSLLGVCGLVIWYLKSAMNLPRQSASADYKKPPVLKVPDTGKLPEATFVPASVTEHTTRTLEMAELERRES